MINLGRMDVIEECGMIRRSAVSAHTALPHQIEEFAISSRLGLAVCDISDCGVSNDNNNNNMKFLRPAAHSIDDNNSSVLRLKFSAGVKSSEQQQQGWWRSSSCCQHSTQYFCNWIINCGQCLCGVLATPFYRFLARFSGRRRTYGSSSSSSTTKLKLVHSPVWVWLLIIASSVISVAEACSSRATPKPRPPAPTPRPNITFHTYACPPNFDEWYCLNGATCFTVIISDSTMYNCECADGYMGPRCEFKDLDGSYLPSQHRSQLETASIAGGATIAIFLVFILCMAAYIRMQRRVKARMAATPNSVDCVDSSDALGGIRPTMPKRVFGHHNNQHAHPWREHLQRGLNTVAVPMENIPQGVTDISQACENSEIHWMDSPGFTTITSSGDRLQKSARVV